MIELSVTSSESLKIDAMGSSRAQSNLNLLEVSMHRGKQNGRTDNLIRLAAESLGAHPDQTESAQPDNNPGGAKETNQIVTPKEQASFEQPPERPYVPPPKRESSSRLGSVMELLFGPKSYNRGY